MLTEGKTCTPKPTVQGTMTAKALGAHDERPASCCDRGGAFLRPPLLDTGVILDGLPRVPARSPTAVLLTAHGTRRTTKAPR